MANLIIIAGHALMKRLRFIRQVSYTEVGIEKIACTDYFRNMPVGRSQVDLLIKAV